MFFLKEDLKENRSDYRKLTPSYPYKTKNTYKAKKNHPVNEMIFYIFTTLPKSNKNKNNQRQFYNSNIVRIFDIHKFIYNFLHVFFQRGFKGK